MKSAAAIKKQIQSLREKIAEMDRLYYQKNRPAMSDMEYDFLRKDLERLENEYPKIAEELSAKEGDKTSPTKKVGDDKSGKFETAKHLSPMLSLENTYSREELEAFDAKLKRALKAQNETENEAEENLEYIVEPKIDGLSISVVYENGKLTRAVTRGDGEEGDIVTQNFLTIDGVPNEWPEKNSKVIELRGEVYLTNAQFEKINAECVENGEEAYANPRNLAAGTLKLKDNTAEVKRRGLRVIFYTTGARENTELKTQAEFLEFLKINKFPTHEKYWKATGINEVWEKVGELDKLRGALEYQTDGAVVKLNDFEWQKKAGMTARAPRWAFAYKYAPERAQTKLKKITIQVGRTGVLTPVAELEPTLLSGSTVSRATLHNAEEIARKDIREGDTVIIEKAGEVIPAVVNVVLEKRPKDSVIFEFPQNCPSCGERVVKTEGEVAIRCVNENCPEQLKRGLEHFASRNAMAIDGLGEAVVNQLVEKKLAKTPADIYRLVKEDFLTLEGFAEKSAVNLAAAINASKQNDLWRLIHALGILQVGETVSQLLAEEFGEMKTLLVADDERLLQIHGIGESMAKSIVDFFAKERTKTMLQEFEVAGVNMKTLGERKKKEGILSGKKFVLTGTLKNYTRSQAKENLESLGATVVDSVSKNIDALIAGDEAGSKLEKARSLGVKILDEEEFEKLVLR